MELGETFKAFRLNGKPVKNGTVYAFQSHRTAKAMVYKEFSTAPSVVHDTGGWPVWVDWFEAIAPDGKVVQFFTRHFTFEKA